MADHTEVVDTVDDSEMFRSTLDDAPQEKPVEAKPEPARDEQGRFIPKEAEEAKPEIPPVTTEAKPAEATPEAKDDPNGQVPSWRLREVREAREAAEQRAEQAYRERQALQQQMQQMQAELQAFKQPKAEPVDFFADPDQALQQRINPIEQRFEKLERDLRLATSRASLMAEKTAPVVQKMESFIAKAMSENHPEMQMLAMQMRSSDDPAAVAMKWYERNDPEMQRSKYESELLKDPVFLAKAMEAARTHAGGQATPAGTPNIKLPPSLTRAPGSGNVAAQDDSDMSDRALFQHATRG